MYKLIITHIKNYLNMYNNKLELKVRRQRIRIKSRRLSSHKIFVSKGEFKHTNDRVMINIYIYNRQKYNYFYKLKKIYEKLLRKKIINFLLLIIIHEKTNIYIIIIFI